MPLFSISRIEALLLDLHRSSHLAGRLFLARVLNVVVIFSVLWVPTNKTFCQTNPPSFLIEHITPSDGLASGKVISIAQDTTGYLWIGTQDGLQRYDGHELKLYRNSPDDSTSLSNNICESVYVDRSGTLWVGTWNGLNRYDPLKDEFVLYRHQPDHLSGLPGNMVIDIQEDATGRLWVAIAGGGVCRYHLDTETFIRYRSEAYDSTSSNPFNPNQLYLDRAGTLWVGSGSPWDEYPNKGGLHRYDPSQDAFVAYHHDPADPNTLSHNEITALYEDRNGVFWVATWGDGLQVMDRQTGKFYPAEENPYGHRWPEMRSVNGSGGGIRFLHEDSHGHLWIGGFPGGLDCYEDQTGDMIHFEQGSPMNHGITGPELWSIFEDETQTLWIVTWNGLNKIVFEQSPFDVIGNGNQGSLTLRDPHVEALLRDQQGRIWAGTWTGVELLDFENGTSRLFELGNSATDRKGLPSMVLDLCEDKEGNLLVGTHSRGLQHLDLNSGRFQPFPRQDVQKGSLINDVFQDSSGKIWGISVNGVYIWNADQNSYNSFPHSLEIDSLIVLTIEPTQDSMAWLGTNIGLFLLNMRTMELSPFLNGVSVEAILTEDSHSLWVGTQGSGLLNVNPLDTTISTFTTQEGLPSDFIRSLLLDDSGKLWVATRKGIAWLEQGNTAIRTFPTADAPPFSEFFPNSAIRLPDGKLMFGGREGILRIDPLLVTNDTLAPHPVIKRLSVFDQNFETKPGFDRNQFQLIQQEADFPHHLNDLTFEFAGLHFVQPSAHTFRYKLEPIEADWREVGNQRTAIYPNLQPGTYTFRVQAANSDGVWSMETASMEVIIRSPWWQTPWAYVVYVLLGFGLLWMGYRDQRKRLIRKERVRSDLIEANLRAEVAEAQAQQLQELDEAKARLYANITHEFRTPLTVMLGMTERIEGNPKEKGLIHRNGKNLLRLINQLLDLAKLEGGSFVLHPVQGEVIQYLRYLTESFRSLAQERRLHLEFSSEVEEQVMDYDADNLQHIIYNLLSNALKFTPEGGKVTLHVQTIVVSDAPWLQIRVSDTGIGISPEQVDRIFDRFYQADAASTRKREGTGVGLALTLELIELMGGSITVKSELSRGSSFAVQLPIQLGARTPQSQSQYPSVYDQLIPIPGNLSEPQPSLESDEGKPVLVLIEDNTDVATYIRMLLQDQYTLYVENNGQTGVERVWEVVPDIVISDVMMPEKDGYEVCELLKNDERSSHIPIILLTARGEDEGRIKGLRKGADAYLNKPFNQEELLVRLTKLIELRKTLKQTYSDPKWLSPDQGSEASSLEDRFLLRLAEVVRTNLDNPQFGVKDLCAAANLSNMQVNRKLKALTGKTPSRFIRSVRLQEATTLLKSGEYNVSEAAYAVGFSDPNYFSTSFSEEFGHPPSEMSPS